MKVRFQDLSRLHSSVRADISSAISSVMDSSAYIGGRYVAQFEEQFAAAHGLAGAVGCGSGTDALALALRALGVGPGDEVVVPSMTFVATAEAVLHVGAEPVIADVDGETLLLTNESVERVRTSKTAAVIAVHLYGSLVPFESLQAWRRAGLLVVEDAAQAHLARWEGASVGSVGHAACFSFYPGKNLGALGDGGAVVSDDLELLDTIRVLRDHGRESKYVHHRLGWCSRLDGLQGAVLLAKLEHLPKWTEARRSLAAHYAHLLDGVTEVVPFHNGAVHHLFVTRVPANLRDKLREAFDCAGIETGIHYPVPLSLQPYLRRYTIGTPCAEQASSEVLSLPMDPLMTKEEVAYVCEQLEMNLRRLAERSG